MSSDPIDHLGLTCPSGGDFYICKDSKVRFLGCCAVDPCGDLGGECPSASVRPAGFDPKRYSEIFTQSCSPSTEPSKWYTCASGPTFLGCCTSNPCDNESICPGEHLVAAGLSDNPSDAAPFLTMATTSSPTQTGSPTSSPTSGSSSQGDSSAPIGALIGGILGGLSVLAVVIFFLYRSRRRRKAALPTAQPYEYHRHMSQLPGSPYHDSFRSPSMPMPPPSVPPSYAVSTNRTSVSASLGSMMGFKRASAGRESQVSSLTDNEALVSNWGRGANRSSHAYSYSNSSGQPSPGLLNPVVELEGLSSAERAARTPPLRGNTVYHEVEGSVPAGQTRGAWS